MESFKEQVKRNKKKKDILREEYYDLMKSLSTKELLILYISHGSQKEGSFSYWVKRIKKFKDLVK